jgi:hypothetical protein
VLDHRAACGNRSASAGRAWICNGLQMRMTNTERVTLHRHRKRLGLRPVTVIVSEQEIDFLLARDYELTRRDDRSIGRGGIGALG